MKIFATTERLLLTEILPEHASAMLTMDASPEVLKYLPEQPATDISQAEEKIQFIRNQYVQNGIGRWAVIRKEDNAFLGWCGIKLNNDKVRDSRTNYYDIGYRFLAEYWNKGYAYESSKAVLDYAFEVLQLKTIYATVMPNNTGSKKVLEKLGMTYGHSYTDEEGYDWMWYVVER